MLTTHLKIPIMDIMYYVLQYTMQTATHNLKYQLGEVGPQFNNQITITMARCTQITYQHQLGEVVQFHISIITSQLVFA